MDRRIGVTLTRDAIMVGALAAMFANLLGCHSPAGKSPAANEDPSNLNASEPAVSAAAATRDGVEPHAAEGRETWDVVYMGGAKVGHTRTQFSTLQEKELPLVQIKAFSEMSMKRFNQSVEQKITITSVEHPDGRLVRCASSMGTPPNETTTVGRFEGGKLRLTTTTPGKQEVTALAWDATWRGFFGSEQIVREKPLKPGEKRTIRSLLPVFNIIGEIDLTAIDYEATPLLDGERSLLRIETRTRIGGTSIDSIFWTDEQGETLKTSIPSLNQETYRTTREIALQSSGGSTFDLGESSVVKTSRPLVQPHLTREIVYRASIPDGDPAKTFPSGATQAVKRLDEHTAEITVRALRPENAVDQALGESTPPSNQDLAPNSLIQSEDAAVVAIAESVAVGESNSWLVAQALEKRVQDLVEVTEFSQAIASAAEVARTKQGDCTEHAMLLAAACRARKIPARVAIGLVYYGQASGFAYHMWTEVWVNGHWIPLDATLGQGGIGAAHLKVAESNLAGTSGYTAFLPVFEVMGRLKLEIVAVDGTP